MNTVPFAIIVALSSPVTLLTKIIHIPSTSEVEIHTRQNYAILVAILQKGSYFVKNLLSQ